MEKKLKQALDKRGLRYNFVAKHVGVTDGYFNNLINGHVNMPIVTLLEILYVANIDFEEVRDDYPQWSNYYRLR